MSYKVLSLKLRPQLFDDVIGQTHVTQTLQNAIKMDRVAHGYIFSGSRGVGKTTTARILAKVLNCKKQNQFNPCGNCTNCIEITKGNNLDVQELDGASNRGIDEIRNLREAAKYPPNSGEYRIYIIDEVHMLTREAFNALLKTLEEPPKHMVFILATTDAYKIPTTILSRTQRFDFRPISIENISNYLVKILKNENIAYDLESINLIAKKASGSMRDALSIIDQLIAFSPNNLDVETVSELIGIIKENLYLEIMQNVENQEVDLIINHLNKIINEGYSISDYIIGFNDFIRNCLIIKTNSKLKVNISSDSIKWVNNCRFSVADFLEMLDLSLQFESNIKSIKQLQVSIETLFIKLSMMNIDDKKHQELKKSYIDSNISQKSINHNDVNKNVDLNVKHSSNYNNNENSSDDFSPQNINDINTSSKILSENSDKSNLISLDDIKNVWSKIIKKLEISNSKTSNILEETKLLNFDNGELLIEIIDGHKFHVNTLEKDIDQIELASSEILKQKIKVKFHVNETSNKNKTAKIENKEHPLFSKVLDTFNGEIKR
tara:strand:- start:414 stop:2060 length:1647 start_codon:yes stop_codon:yes gene_type:complete